MIIFVTTILRGGLMCFHPTTIDAIGIWLCPYNGHFFVLGITKAPQIEIVSKDQCF